MREEKVVLVDKEDFQLNKLYYLYDQDIYVRYNSAKNILVEDPNY